MADVIYAFGDVHGREDLLDRAETIIRAISPHIPAVSGLVVGLGDFCDKGPKSREVYQRLMRGTMAGMPLECIRGNHDVWFAEAIAAFKARRHGWQSWLERGDEAALACLRSFGVKIPPGQRDENFFRRVMAGAVANVPDDLLSFIRGMRPVLIEGGAIFTHAGLDPASTPDMQENETYILGTPVFWQKPHDFGMPVCVGHSVMPQPYLSSQIVGLDTGADDSGILTIAAISGGRVVLVIAATDTKLSRLPVIVDGGDDDYLGKTNLWWRAVIRAAPEPPILGFDDPARLHRFCAVTGVGRCRAMSMAQARSMGSRPGMMLLTTRSCKPSRI